MKKKFYYIISFLIICFSVNAQEIILKVSDIVGYANVRFNNQNWQPLEKFMILPVNSDLITSFGSQVKINADIGIDITVYQLSSIRIQKLRVTPKVLETEIFLKIGKIKSNIVEDPSIIKLFSLVSREGKATCRKGEFIFSNFPLRGTYIESINSIVIVRSEGGPMLAIRKGEIVGIDPLSKMLITKREYMLDDALVLPADSSQSKGYQMTIKRPGKFPGEEDQQGIQKTINGSYSPPNLPD